MIKKEAAKIQARPGKGEKKQKKKKALVGVKYCCLNTGEVYVILIKEKNDVEFQGKYEMTWEI